MGWHRPTAAGRRSADATGQTGIAGTDERPRRKAGGRLDPNGSAWAAPKKPPDAIEPAPPQSDRALLYRSQHGRCAGCKHELPRHVLTITHATPRSRGGPDSLGNLQLMCHACNAIKGNRDMGHLKQQLQI